MIGHAALVYYAMSEVLLRGTLALSSIYAGLSAKEAFQQPYIDMKLLLGRDSSVVGPSLWQ